MAIPARIVPNASATLLPPVFLVRLIQCPADFLTGRVEIFIQFFTRLFRPDFHIVRRIFRVLLRLFGGLTGLLPGALLFRRGAGRKCDSEGNEKGWFHTQRRSNSLAN